MGNTCEGIKDYNGDDCDGFPCCTEKEDGYCITWQSQNVSSSGDVSTTSCNKTDLPLVVGQSNNTSMTGDMSTSEWGQVIYYADPTNDSTCSSLSETDCKKNVSCGWDPTSAKGMCGQSCCGVVNTAGAGGKKMQNNGIGTWSNVQDLPSTRTDWAPSCEYLARNTLYNYDYTACYTTGKDIRLKQYFQAAQSTQAMCVDQTGVDCKTICDCDSSLECNNNKCELLNVAVMGSNSPSEIADMGITEVMNDLQGFISTDMTYLSALLAILAAF